MKRGKLQEHKQSECSMRVVKCKAARHGCKWEGCFREYGSHLIACDVIESALNQYVAASDRPSPKKLKGEYSTDIKIPVSHWKKDNFNICNIMLATHTW